MMRRLRLSLAVIVGALALGACAPGVVHVPRTVSDPDADVECDAFAGVETQCVHGQTGEPATSYLSCGSLRVLVTIDEHDTPCDPGSETRWDVILTHGSASAQRQHCWDIGGGAKAYDATAHATRCVDVDF